jgi:hypothetical protein
MDALVLSPVLQHLLEVDQAPVERRMQGES